MTLFRMAGWMMLLIGAGLLAGEVYNLVLFLLGFAIIAFNPVKK